MTIAEIMQNKLQTAFSPTALEIVDESHLHAGHMGARPEGETHFRVTIVSAAFAGAGRVQRHRMVHEVLADELRDRVHALALLLRAPEDA
ncbi:BolA family protein [Thalassobaculum sp. OXR-137]|uniref:BolA family protein n=1 Tax=Thalassobaculum sp. OXR-137 TaxID=3100173 RepID=UPI002AC9189E|nr:BolA family protein [Thalassobaculum sp. OXR-137]WPZ34987.1 BolA family protein [Thalassobaculum sp. OXR-137]